MSDDLLGFLARWALLHELADEGWKAAVTRGAELGEQEMRRGPDALVDGLAALVSEEKDRLKDRLAADGSEDEDRRSDVGPALEELRFELAEMRGRLETLQASVDALLADRDPARDDRGESTG
jgi:hypothetical protein